MSTITQFHIATLEHQELIDVLSAEPDKQSVELSFIERFLQVNSEKSAEALALAESATPEIRFSTAFARMKRPMFARLAMAMESTIPETDGFGRFKNRN